MKRPARKSKAKSAVKAKAVAIQTVPRGTVARPPITTLDPRLKKIFVAAEGTFVLNNANDIHKVVIQTPAFDLAGWIDLSKMRAGGDTLLAEIRASFANRTNVSYGKWQWSGPQLITLGDMANRQYLSGTHIEIWFQQTTSHDNFANKVEYAYQFIVESQ